MVHCYIRRGIWKDMCGKISSLRNVYLHIGTDWPDIPLKAEVENVVKLMWKQIEEQDFISFSWLWQKF